MNFNDIKSNISNKDKIAVVVVGYNRLKSMTRLLTSLKQAEYPITDVPLVISIDCSGDQDLYSYVLEFEWPYGEKYVNIQKERLGLKNHIFKCGDLTQYFKAIILLEDDLVVSPYYYSYTLKVLQKYGDIDAIAQISLYKNEMNGYVGLPFDNFKTGADVFLMQDVSTWGECWNKRMWDEFVEWMEEHDEAYISDVDMPLRIKQWTRAWSKYYNAFVVDKGKYVLYPNVAVTTNFSDAGEHGGDNNSAVQVSLLQADFEYRLPDFDELVKYDIYFNNQQIYNWIDISEAQVCLDLYGFNRAPNGQRYILSSRILPYNVIKAFALNMRPIEMNIYQQIGGHGLYLYDTRVNVSSPESFNSDLVSYYIRNFNIRILVRYLFRYYMNAIRRKLFRCKK